MPDRTSSAWMVSRQKVVTLIENILMAAVVTMAGREQAPAMRVDVSTSAFMRCVSHRESRGKPTAVSSSGRHRGKYQVTPAMAVGMSWHVLPWLRTWRTDAAEYAAKLRHTPMNHWPEAVQDAAFVLTLHHNGHRWVGWRHWYLAGSACNKLVP